MANVLVFEDYYETIDDIHQALSGTTHEVVGVADSLLSAQQYISQIVSREIDVDVLLLDGNLDAKNTPHEFRHTFPLDGTEPIKKTLFGKVKPPQPREIIVPNEEQGFGAHARMVKKILEACDISLPIIGISGDSMDRSGVEVDIDLGKSRLGDRLVPAIESLVD